MIGAKEFHHWSRATRRWTFVNYFLGFGLQDFQLQLTILRQMVSANLQRLGRTAHRREQQRRARFCSRTFHNLRVLGRTLLRKSHKQMRKFVKKRDTSEIKVYSHHTKKNSAEFPQNLKIRDFENVHFKLTMTRSCRLGTPTVSSAVAVYEFLTVGVWNWPFSLTLTLSAKLCRIFSKHSWRFE